MSQNTHESMTASVRHNIFPDFASHADARSYLLPNTHVQELFLELPDKMKQELLDFCIGKQGLRLTYDCVFQKLFRPDLQKERLESLLSAILERTVQIISVIPREGTQLVERGSFVIMDVLVQLDDGSYANVEMQKIGYNFPLARADCYASDIIMRQYVKQRTLEKEKFSFKQLNKVYCIILMEHSPAPFHTAPDKYIHKRVSRFASGIYPDNAGLHEDIFICLDSFHQITHTITKDSTLQEAWLTFLCSTDVQTISSLINAFPFFAEIYREIKDFLKQPEELINMFSKELYIMDRNMEKLMIEEWQEEMQATREERDYVKAEYDSVKSEYDSVKSELDSAKNELDSAKNELDFTKTELNSAKNELTSTKDELTSTKDELSSVNETCQIYKLRLDGKSRQEIAEILEISLDKVDNILDTLI